MANSWQQGGSIAGAHSPAMQNQQTGAGKSRPSDQRFRSFAERYFVARAAFFRQDPKGLAEDTWSCILDAKRAYQMIARTGQHIDPEEGIF